MKRNADETTVNVPSVGRGMFDATGPVQIVFHREEYGSDDCVGFNVAAP
jgi:hypothetical protein